MTVRSLSAAQLEAIRAGSRARFERARQRGIGKQISYAVQAVVIFAIVGLLHLMPVDAASNLGGWIGRTFLAPRLRTDAVLKTIRVVYPDASEDQISAIIREMGDNVIRVLAEFARIKSFAGQGNPRVRFEGAEHIEAARKRGRGILFVTGHFGNWEIGTIPMRVLGLDGSVSVMPPTNPYVYGWLARLRASVGLAGQANAGEGVYKTFRRELSAGRVAAILADQRLKNGIQVPFFGIETTTNVIPARLARTLEIDVIPGVVRRVPGRTAHFVVTFFPRLEFQTTGDVAADERAFSRRINAFFESEILRAPGQWLWLDPRWEEM